MKVDKATLLKDPIVVESVIIHSPAVSLIGNLSGNNLQKLLQNIQSSGSASKKEEKSSGAASKKFVVREVIISGGQLQIAASALNQKVSQTLPLPEIRLRNIGTGGNGVSAREIATQIITPLLISAAKEGISALGKEGIKQLQGQGLKELNKVIPGFLK